MTPDEMLDKMSLQEIIQVAKDGNQDAVKTIYAIGVECTRQGENQDFKNAEFFLGLAADLGLAEAAWDGMKFCKRSAYAYMNLCSWKEAIVRIGNVQKMASIVFNDDDFADDIDEISGENRFSIAEEYFLEADYDMAICLKELGEEQRALSWLEKIKPDHLYYEKYQILRGILLFSVADNEEILRATYNELRVVEPNSAYIPKKTEVMNNNDEVQYEQINFMHAARILEFLYRNGLPGVLIIDVNHAHEILESALSKLSASGCRQIIEEALSHYKKKIFGGFQYLN